MTVKPRELPKPYTAPLCLEVDPETKVTSIEVVYLIFAV
jgi:hypothetical protein